MTIQEFNVLPHIEAKTELIKCCGSGTWAERLLSERPFDSIEELKNCSDKIWTLLDENSWKEAFSHHPKIGDMESLKKKFASTANWAVKEQAAVKTAGIETLNALEKGNMDYENKFGFIFIICATGRSASEMLDALNSRINNSQSTELKIAVQEQNKITHLRLNKLFS
jgi:2-oxo-4-hydroxy-4-carboxy-5-ureidoimidazoline decarboxylase